MANAGAEAPMNAEQLLAALEDAVNVARKIDDWRDWRAMLDVHLTYELKVSMTRPQRIRLHELTHGFVLLADPDGTWSDRLSDRREREFRASLEQDAAQTEVSTTS